MGAFFLAASARAGARNGVKNIDLVGESVPWAYSLPGDGEYGIEVIMMNVFSNRRFVVLAVLAIVGAFVAQARGAGQKTSVPVVAFPAKSISIASQNGDHAFFVEIASSTLQQQRGLMYRTYLPENRGMLFIFQHEKIVRMWMRNTRIPLDMLFIGKDNKIKRIQAMTTPDSDALISSGVKVKTVLEIQGGLARKLGISPGDTLIDTSYHPQKK